MRSPGFKVMLRGSDSMLRMCKEGREGEMESKIKIQNRKRKAQGELVGYQCFNGQVRVLLHTGNTKSMSTSH